MIKRNLVIVNSVLSIGPPAFANERRCTARGGSHFGGFALQILSGPRMRMGTTPWDESGQMWSPSESQLLWHTTRDPIIWAWREPLLVRVQSARLNQPCSVRLSDKACLSRRIKQMPSTDLGGGLLAVVATSALRPIGASGIYASRPPRHRWPPRSHTYRHWHPPASSRWQIGHPRLPGRQ